MPRVRFPSLSKSFTERDKSRQAGGPLKERDGIESRKSEERSTSGGRQPSADFNRVISPVSQG